MESLKPKHIAIDFDNTLAHFEGGSSGMFEIFSKRGVSEDLIRELYEETKKEGGFNINKLILKIKDRVGIILDDNEVKREFSVWLDKNMKLYLDTHDFLTRVAISGTPFSIITVGDREFQEQKIKALGITPHSLHVVDNVGDKPAVLHEMIHKDMWPIVYIDDKSAELDAIRKVIGEKHVATIKINREDSPYRDQRAEYKHREISSLKEIEI